MLFSHLSIYFLEKRKPELPELSCYWSLAFCCLAVLVFFFHEIKYYFLIMTEREQLSYYRLLLLLDLANRVLDDCSRCL